MLELVELLGRMDGKLQSSFSLRKPRTGKVGDGVGWDGERGGEPGSITYLRWGDGGGVETRTKRAQHKSNDHSFTHSLTHSLTHSTLTGGGGGRGSKGRRRHRDAQARAR